MAVDGLTEGADTSIDWLTTPESRFLMDGVAGAIEVLVNGVQEPRAVALLCHPHPQHGGTMENKVVFTLTRACRDSGVVAVRFNFRGVGRSAGLHDDGLGELDDAISVLGCLRTQWQHLPVVLGGFSFGAAIAAGVAQRVSCVGIMLAAPPVPRYGLATISRIDVPVLLLQGLEDQVVESAAVLRWFDGLKAPRKVVRCWQHGNHFFDGRLPELKMAVSEFLEQLSL